MYHHKRQKIILKITDLLEEEQKEYEKFCSVINEHSDGDDNNQEQEVITGGLSYPSLMDFFET